MQMLGMVINFLIIYFGQMVMVEFLGIDSTMAWIVAMFLMVIYECDEFMYPGLHPQMKEYRK